MNTINTACKGKVSSQDIGLLLIRVMIGVVFIFHGSQKLFGAFGGPGIEGFAGWLASMNVPLPTLNAYMAAGTEFFGGIAILIGLTTRITAIPMAITMIVAIVMVHGEAFSVQQNGMEYPLTLGVVLIALTFTGAGRISLDHQLRNVVMCGKKRDGQKVEQVVSV